jgi:LysM repeat protein
MVDIPFKGQLEKLTIFAHRLSDYSDLPVGLFVASFNPAEYTQVYDAEYVKGQGEGTTSSPMVFRRIPPQQYAFDFIFDGTGAAGEKITVYARIQEFFALVGYDGEIHRPRFLKLIWGTLESRCILVKAEVTYRMFRPDGVPLRATLKATFSENMDDKTRALTANDKSADLMRSRMVMEGDTLPGLAYQIYGDPAYYLQLARSNELDSFRELQVGQRLFFPPVEKVPHG